MSLRKDPTLYTAVFRDLKLKAWGFDKVIKGAWAITVFQQSCSPERWKARPSLSRNTHTWQASTAEECQKLVAADFEHQVTTWGIMPEKKDVRPSLRSAADLPGGRELA